MFGLIERDIEYIVKAMKKFNEIEKAIVFGSRAIGNYKKGSDVDIAIIGDGIDSKTVYKLDDYLNEVYPLPYFFDILQYNCITNENLKKHIDNEGKIIYERKYGVFITPYFYKIRIYLNKRAILNKESYSSSLIK